MTGWSTADLREPGLCRHGRCQIRGPRCIEGNCADCCKEQHKNAHEIPLKVGEFSPRPATLIIRREIRGGTKHA